MEDTYKRETCRETLRLTLLIGICGDPMRHLPCVQLASYQEGSPLMWMMLLHVNLNADDDDETS